MSGRAATVSREKGKASAETATRELLLIAAGDLMVERGSTDISLSDIATKSGHNSALVKYYFGNKSGLLMALLRKTLRPGLEQLEHLPTMPISPQDKLRIHISGMVNTYFRYPFVNHLMHQMITNDPVVYGPMIAREISEPIAKAQKAILDEGIKAGHFRPVDPMLFYFHLVGACDQFFYGRYQLEHVFGLTEISEALKRQYVEHIYGTFLNGILISPDQKPSTVAAIEGRNGVSARVIGSANLAKGS